MKNTFATLLISLFSLFSFSQNYVDIIHLKDGTEVRGEITEQHPLDSLKITTNDGQSFTYTYAEIEKMNREISTVINLPDGRTKFIINEKINRSTYDGKEIRKMKFKELKTIWLEPNDATINSQVKKLNSKHSVSGALLYTGVGLMNLGALLMLTATTSAINNGGDTNSGPGLGVMVVSLGIVIGGAVAHSGYNQLEKEIMEGYNGLDY